MPFVANIFYNHLFSASKFDNTENPGATVFTEYIVNPETQVQVKNQLTATRYFNYYYLNYMGKSTQKYYPLNNWQNELNAKVTYKFRPMWTCRIENKFTYEDFYNDEHDYDYLEFTTNRAVYDSIIKTGNYESFEELRQPTGTVDQSGNYEFKLFYGTKNIHQSDIDDELKIGVDFTGYENFVANSNIGLLYNDSKDKYYNYTGMLFGARGVYIVPYLTVRVGYQTRLKYYSTRRSESKPLLAREDMYHLIRLSIGREIFHQCMVEYSYAFDKLTSTDSHDKYEKSVFSVGLVFRR
jgi:hypothetical protein